MGSALPYLPRHLTFLAVLGEWAQGLPGIGLQPWLELPAAPAAVGDTWEQSIAGEFVLRSTLIGYETVQGYRCAQVRCEIQPAVFAGLTTVSFAVDEGFVVQDRIDAVLEVDEVSAGQSLTADLAGRQQLSRTQAADLARAMAVGPRDGTTARPALPHEWDLAGRPAPAFRLADLAGHITTLADHLGQVVVLTFGVAWDPITVQQLGPLVALDREYRDRGVAVLAVLFEPEVVRPLGRLEALVDSWEIPFPLLLGDAAVYRDYDLRQAIPTTLLVDADGVVRRVHYGYWARLDLEPEVQALLGAAR